MYHLELRQFPRTVWRFNLEEREVRAIVEPWVQQLPVELGEHRWSPHQAQITILEGPRLMTHELSMGRGWRAAQRDGENVTERVLAEASSALTMGGEGATPPLADGPTGGAAGGDVDSLALAVQLGSLLGSQAAPLLDAWRDVAARSPDLSPSESLGQAERELAESSHNPL